MEWNYGYKTKVSKPYGLRYILGIIHISFVMIPWVSFGINKMDSQLWAPISGILFLITCFRLNVETKIFSILSVIPFVLIVSLFYENDLSSQVFRAFASYSSFALTFVASFYFLKAYGPPLRLVCFFNILYILIAVLQIAVDSDIVSFMLNNRTSLDRGVTSLTAEPTYFGVFLFFVSWWYLVVSGYRPSSKLKVLIFANLLAIIFLAQSSMTVVFILVSLSIFSIYRFKINQIIPGIIFIALVIFFILFSLEGTRIHMLLWTFIQVGPVGVVSLDASVNSRVADVVLPLHGFVENIFMPGGFTSYGEVSDQLRYAYNNLFWYGGGSDTIMSYVGSIVFELGFIGVVYIFMIGFLISDRSRSRRYESFLLFLLLFAAIPLGFTLIPFLLATFCSMPDRYMTYRGYLCDLPAS